MTPNVVKKGNYVLRPCCANSKFVHEVLKWLDQKDISLSPKFLGIADDGREITSFLQGYSPENLGNFNDNQLFEAGKIIKTLHVALSDFYGCSNNQTVCHNDLSPCNFMFANGLPYAVFDWDAAEINDPLNDVAYACWMWCDIGNNENSPAEVGNKIKVILDGYQLCKEQRNLLITKMHEQIQRVSESLYTDKYIKQSQWAYNCGLWLGNYQNKISPQFTL